jgi:hypothetical protein
MGGGIFSYVRRWNESLTLWASYPSEMLDGHQFMNGFMRFLDSFTFGLVFAARMRRDLRPLTECYKLPPTRRL